MLTFLGGVKTDDDDDDDDPQRSPSNSRQGPGLAGVSAGVITPRKKSVKAGAACSVGKACTYTRLKMTVCSTSDRLEKHMGKRKTGCCWYKFSEFKSLESSDSVQHNEGNQETRRNR